MSAGPDRRWVVGGGLALASAAAGGARGSARKLAPRRRHRPALVVSETPAGDMVLGRPNAPVAVTIYASLGCPICAKWHGETFAAFKAKYLDTGRARLVLKEMTNGDGPVAAAGFLLARCAGKGKYFQVVEAVWRQEAPFLETDKAAEKRHALVQVAASAGINERQFDACASNDAALNALNDKVQHTVIVDHVEATPTFVINGKVCEDCIDPKNLDKAILAAEGASK